MANAHYVWKNTNYQHAVDNDAWLATTRWWGVVGKQLPKISYEPDSEKVKQKVAIAFAYSQSLSIAQKAGVEVRGEDSVVEVQINTTDIRIKAGMTDKSNAV